MKLSSGYEEARERGRKGGRGIIEVSNEKRERDFGNESYHKRIKIKLLRRTKFLVDKIAQLINFK